MKNEAPLQNLADFDNKSLLIVDDDNPFRERLARAMEKKGFEVTAETSTQKIGTWAATTSGTKLVNASKGLANSLGYKVNIKPHIQIATRAADYHCK